MSYIMPSISQLWYQTYRRSFFFVNRAFFSSSSSFSFIFFFFFLRIFQYLWLLSLYGCLHSLFECWPTSNWDYDGFAAVSLFLHWINKTLCTVYYTDLDAHRMRNRKNAAENTKNIKTKIKKTKTKQKEIM